MAGTGPAIPAGPALKIGMRDPRVPLIRARLSLDGRAEEALSAISSTTLKIASAVADFQRANGLPPSGQSDGAHDRPPVRRRPAAA